MRSPARPIHYSPFAASDERNACSSADAMPSAVMPMALCTSMTALRVAESKVPISASRRVQVAERRQTILKGFHGAAGVPELQLLIASRVRLRVLPGRGATSENRIS